MYLNHTHYQKAGENIAHLMKLLKSCSLWNMKQSALNINIASSRVMVEAAHDVRGTGAAYQHYCVYISYMKKDDRKNSCYKPQSYITIIPSMQKLAGSALFLPQGGTHFQLVPLGSPQGYFMGKFSPLTSIKFLHPMPPRPKVIQIIRPWKNWRDLKKLTFSTLLLH